MGTVYDMLRYDADIIIKESIQEVLPDTAVKKALTEIFDDSKFAGGSKLYLVAVGKAAWQMAKTAVDVLLENGKTLEDGIVITKYGHVKGDIPGVRCFEAAHPVPDESGFEASQKVCDMVSDLSEKDIVLFLLSGGGSALFERPAISGDELKNITEQLLASGADIKEMNAIRKHLSFVKGGRFAQLASPAHIFSIVLSDVIGDDLSVIASGPAYPDSSTCEDALKVIKKYNINISEEAQKMLLNETPKELSNVTTYITGSVRELTRAAERVCQRFGYQTSIFTDELTCEARDAGYILSSKVEICLGLKKKGNYAFIAGGETVVRLTGHGLGGRNQEIAAHSIKMIKNFPAAVFSVGSDGTDGPTDAAGGYVDGESFDKVVKEGLDLDALLADNDSYHLLEKIGGLIVTGPTGTNVNDVSIALVRN